MTLPGHLGLVDHIDAVRAALGRVADLRILDAGCGASALPRQLATRGAECTGVDPFMPPQDWTAEGDGRWRLLTAGAERLPLGDASIDAVTFVFSLHHVPTPSLADAFAEARRVLVPGGRLYVAEPLVAGDFDHLITTFHDESDVRAAAQRALADALPLFATHRASAYVRRERFDGFESFVARMTANTRFNPYSAEDVAAPQVRDRFEALAARNGGAFDQPVKVDLLTTGP